jgi:hypothetical protein
MPKVSRQALREVQRALEEYEAEVKATNLAEDSKQTYLGHTRHFVRWLNDDFTPGEKTG